MADAAACCPLHAQGAKDAEWQCVVRLLHGMRGGGTLEGALLASPELAASAARNVLAAAIAQCNPAERPEDADLALMATGFAAPILSSLAMQQQQQQPHKQPENMVAGITGLPAFLAACVPHAGAQPGTGCLHNCAYLLLLATASLPADSPQHLTRQQLERMQLPRLLQQLQLHGASPSESSNLSHLHMLSLEIVVRVAAVHGGQQQLRLLLGYWRVGGVHQLQVGAPCWPVR